jgi:hypothetical protein
MRPEWIPRPLPSNLEAYDAFRLGLSSRSRNIMTGQQLEFAWSPFIERLKIRGLWTREIEEKLTIMESEMLRYRPEAPAVTEG